MIITTENGKTIDTADLTSEERHVLQKLFAWNTLVASLEQFREKKEQALAAGWNNSGPIRETKALSQVIQHLENQVQKRLKNNSSG